MGDELAVCSRCGRETGMEIDLGPYPVEGKPFCEDCFLNWAAKGGKHGRR